MTAEEKKKRFFDLFTESRDKIYRLCCGYLGGQAEADDLFQEIMVNVWKNLHRFRGEARIGTWVYRIAVNTALVFRKRSRKRAALFPGLQSNPAAERAAREETGVDEQEARLSRLHRSIARLKKQDRLIISLFLEGMRYEDIADVVGITVNYVGVKINRIKSALAKEMKEPDHA